MKYLTICFMVLACSPVTNEYYLLDGGTGLEGPLGMPGSEGAPGDSGTDGQDGLSGLNGDAGMQGLEGAQGPPGDAGSPGQDGQAGLDGQDGLNGDAGIQGPEGLPGIDAPRWVLADADGVEVNAIVEPFRFMGDPRFGATQFECVLVEYVDQQYFGIAYDIQSGAPSLCIKETERSFYYLTSNCDVAYSTNSFEEIQKVEDVFYLAETQPSAIAQNYYRIIDSECVYEEGPSPLALCKFEELSSSVLDFLDNPPYTLTAAY